jgi:hypothetical protein
MLYYYDLTSSRKSKWKPFMKVKHNIHPETTERIDPSDAAVDHVLAIVESSSLVFAAFDIFIYI